MQTWLESMEVFNSSEPGISIRSFLFPRYPSRLGGDVTWSSLSGIPALVNLVPAMEISGRFHAGSHLGTSGSPGRLGRDARYASQVGWPVPSHAHFTRPALTI